MKKAGAHPILNADKSRPSSCDSLEGLFATTLEAHLRLSGQAKALSLEARSHRDEKTLRFLTSLEKELHQDSVLLQTIFEKVRSARRSGLCIYQTDRLLINVVNNQLH